MYMYAWKKGTKDDVLPAVPSGDGDFENDRACLKWAKRFLCFREARNV